MSEFMVTKIENLNVLLNSSALQWRHVHVGRCSAAARRRGGGSPGLVVMGGDSCSKGRESKSQDHILDGHFFILICWENGKFYLKGTKNKWKRSREWPIIFFQKRRGVGIIVGVEISCRDSFTGVSASAASSSANVFQRPHTESTFNVECSQVRVFNFFSVKNVESDATVKCDQIFERSWQQIFLQKWPNLFGVLLG